MSFEKIPKQIKERYLNNAEKNAALAAGIGLLIMVLTSPIAELYVFPKLIVSRDAAQTVKRITMDKGLFVLGMFGYIITFIADIVVAWALYIFLKPVNPNISLLTALFRLIYAAIALVAVANLTSIFRLINTTTYSSFLNSDQLNNQVMLYYYAFKNTWYFGIVLFGIHLGLLGYLSICSNYIPKLFGILLLISSAGYLFISIQPYLFSGQRIDIAKYTFYGELFFMFWLLIKGWRVRTAF